MTYVMGAILGAALGGAVGLLKKRFVWGDYLEREADAPGEASALYTRMLISNFVNIATLAAAFFLRNVQPFNAMAFLIGTAFALAILNRFAMMRTARPNNKTAKTADEDRKEESDR